MTGDCLIPKDIKSWDISQYTKRCSSEELFSILEQPDFWNTVYPIKDSYSYIKKLHDDGYEIYIVTATSHETLHSKMLRFFELYPFIHSNQIIVTQNKKIVDLDLLIDDDPTNLEDGFYTKILFDAPHNQRYNEKEIGAYRCTRWKDVYKIITTEYPIEERWRFIGR